MQFVKKTVKNTQQQAEAVRAWVRNYTGAEPLPPLTRCKHPSFMVMGDTPLPDGACPSDAARIRNGSQLSRLQAAPEPCDRPCAVHIRRHVRVVESATLAAELMTMALAVGR